VLNIKASRAIRLIVLLGAVLTLSLLVSGCSSWLSLKTESKPLVIKPEDFSVFLFESSEEIYRANVKSSQMWASLDEQTVWDSEYSVHYSWLYETYSKWDDHRRSQLAEIMTDYHYQQMAERLIQKEKQTASPDEIIEFMKRDRFFGKNRNTLVDFYSWYGENYALPHYQRIVPYLKQKADITAGRVEKDFDIIGFMEKETGIKLKKKPEALELMLNMRLIGAAGFNRDKDSLYTMRWSSSPEIIWATVFNEFGTPFFRTFTGSWSFKFMARKMKKDEQLYNKFEEDVPYTWEGWIEKNLNAGLARYLNIRKGIARDVGEGVYNFDKEYAQALVKGFDPQKTSLEDFTVEFLKQRFEI